MSDEEKNGTAVLGGDLDELDASPAEEGRDMIVHNKLGQPILHPDGRPFTITLLGSESKLFKQVTAAQADQQRERFNRTRRLDNTAQSERTRLDLLVRMTKKWDISTKGVAIPFNEAEVRKLYLTYPDLLEQVDNFVGNKAHFVKANSPS